MTDRSVQVRDLIVHRYMHLKGVPHDQEQTVMGTYSSFKKHNSAAISHLEQLAWNLNDPEFLKELDRQTEEFAKW